MADRRRSRDYVHKYLEFMGSGPSVDALPSNSPSEAFINLQGRQLARGAVLETLQPRTG